MVLRPCPPGRQGLSGSQPGPDGRGWRRAERDLQNNEIGPLVRKFLQGRPGVDTVDRMRILRLIENMTIGRNAVGYLTESLHGAGSPQAQRIQIARGMQIEDKKSRAKLVASSGKVS